MEQYKKIFIFTKKNTKTIYFWAKAKMENINVGITSENYCFEQRKSCYNITVIVVLENKKIYSISFLVFIYKAMFSFKNYNIYLKHFHTKIAITIQYLDIVFVWSIQIGIFRRLNLLNKVDIKF